MSRRVAAGAGALLDLRFGEPSYPVHPVELFGRAMQRVERRLYRDSRAAGVVHAGIGAAAGLLGGRAARSTALMTFIATAGRGLAEAARRVEHALGEGDLEEARRLLPALVGRDPRNLGEGEIARAVVESVAENTVDAVVAPVLWGAVGGAAGAATYRAINTMDSMVGHRSPRYRRYGTASARLDDLAGWLPARATAALVASVRPGRAAAIWRAVTRDAPAHPSPNAGVAEAAFAGALGLRLGGPLTYQGRPEVRPLLGDGRLPGWRDIDPAIRLCRDVTVGLVAALWMSCLP